MKRINYLLTILLIFITLIISFCAKEPRAELEKAESAFQKATEVNAMNYAADYYTKAKDKLNSAKKLVNAKKYNSAKIMLEEVVKLSQTAVKKTEIRKKQEQEKIAAREKSRKEEMEKRNKIAEKEREAEKIARELAAKEAAKPQKYIVKKGDNLWKIAANIYGKAKFWKVIYEANKTKISDFDKIYAGQELLIPNIKNEQIEAGNVEVLLTELPKRIVIDDQYEVRVFDNLWNIAKDIYKCPLMWKTIYELNKEIIENPCQLFPKQVLKMPPPQNKEIKKTE